MHTITSALLLSLVLPLSSLQAEELKIRDGHPDRYTVVKGDTLWDISAKFLENPWLWPRIWNVNPEVASKHPSAKDGTRTLDNPHLIFPGDVLVFKNGRLIREVPEMAERPPEEIVTGTTTGADPGVTVQREEQGERRTMTSGYVGRTVRLQPKVRKETLEEAIPTIPPEAISPFLTKPLVVGRTELRDAGYVTVGREGRLIMGSGSEFYARGLSDEKIEDYQVFRQGGALRDPDNGKLLAYEAMYLGDARLIRFGDPAKMVVTSIHKEILPTDRLLVAPRKQSLPYYQPKPPTKDVKGWIIAADDAVSEIGPNVVVAISLGRKNGVEEGTVLRIMRHAGKARDPVTSRRYQLPEEQAGLLMVFRSHDDVSYALVMQASQSIHLFDAVITPK